MAQEKRGKFDVKRGNYFQGMMLVDKDFKDEQIYHRQMRHNHNLELHTWGVVRGLDVTVEAGGAVAVTDGLAIDASGREIWWKGGAPQPGGAAGEGKYLVIEWNQEERDEYPPMSGKHLRLIDTASFSWKNDKGENDVVLAQLLRGQPDNNVRRVAAGVRANQNDIEIRPVTKDGSLRLMTGAPPKQRLTIDAGGNVGIGTTAPTEKLDVRSSGPDVAAHIRVANSDASGFINLYPGKAGDLNAAIAWKANTPLRFATAEKVENGAASSFIERVRITGDGKVGIGTANPGFALQVGDHDTVGIWKLCVAGRGPTGNFRKWTLRTGDGSNAADIHKLRLRDENANADRLVIDQDGNVGIRVTNPQSALEVKGNVAIQGTLHFSDGNGNQYADNWIGMFADTEGAKWLHIGGITDAGARRLLLAADRTYIAGSVGIGTASPGGQLEVGTPGSITKVKFGGEGGDVHHLTSTRDLVFNSANGNFVFRKLEKYSDLREFTNLMTINNVGNVAITGKISCGGYIALKTYHNTYVAADIDKRTMRQNERRVDHEQFTLEMACSREFKENISDISVEEAMTTLQVLNPIRYDYKGEKAFRQNLGFIAEEMPDNLASEDRKSISPFEIIPVLTKVAKEQQKSIAALQETIRALQGEVQRNFLERNDDERANTTPA